MGKELARYLSSHILGCRSNACLILACSSLFTAPTNNQQVDVNQPVTFAWDNSCLNSSSVDIYLYAPYSASTSVIQIFEKVDNSDGSYIVSGRAVVPMDESSWTLCRLP